jgi:hypothetical protein
MGRINIIWLWVGIVAAGLMFWIGAIKVLELFYLGGA